MSKLGVTDSVQLLMEGPRGFEPPHFNWNSTAHMLDEAVMADSHVPGAWALCGERLAYMRDEAELREERHKEGRIQKVCKRCMRKAEGTVRVALLGPLTGPFNLEIAYRGEWVHFGSVANMESNDINWIDGYRKLCQEVLRKFLEGQTS